MGRVFSTWFSATATAALVALVTAGCGGDGSGSESGPSTAAERDATAQMKYCFEGAGALTARPGEHVEQLDRTPSGPDADGAKRILVAYWADTGHAVHVYHASEAGTTQKIAESLSVDGVEWSDRVLVVPDAEDPPSEDEALLAADCLL